MPHVGVIASGARCELLVFEYACQLDGIIFVWTMFVEHIVGVDHACTDSFVLCMVLVLMCARVHVCVVSYQLSSSVFVTLDSDEF